MAKTREQILAEVEFAKNVLAEALSQLAMEDIDPASEGVEACVRKVLGEVFYKTAMARQQGKVQQ
jgi:hypothetical protein